MKRKFKIILFLCVALVLLYASWQFGLRYRMVSKLYHSPNIHKRTKILPEELDLIKAPITNGEKCNIGYAEFMISLTNSMVFSSEEGSYVNCDSKEFSLNIYPFQEFDSLEINSIFLDLPLSHDVLKHSLSSNLTHLDRMILIEHITVPSSLLQGLFLDTRVFVLAMVKGVMPYGKHGTYTIKTDTIRGLVLVGDEYDTNSAMVTIEDLSGSQTVFLEARMPSCQTGNILSKLMPILKTFKFKMDGQPSEEDIEKMIKQAGINPMIVDESNNKIE